jgi:HEAT repeat protein
VPALGELARAEDAGLRKAAVHALGSFPGDASAAALTAALSDPVEDVRWNAALALARRRDPRAAPVLLQMMDRAHLAAIPDLTAEQREEAIQQAAAAAGSVPDPALRKTLQDLVDADTSPQVKEAARRALAAQP